VCWSSSRRSSLSLLSSLFSLLSSLTFSPPMRAFHPLLPRPGVTQAERTQLSAWAKNAGALSHRIAPTGDFLRATFPYSGENQAGMIAVHARDRCDLVLELSAAHESSLAIAHLVQMVVGRLTAASCAQLREREGFPEVDNQSESLRAQHRSAVVINAFQQQAKADASSLGSPANQRRSYGIPADAKVIALVFGVLCVCVCILFFSSLSLSRTLSLSLSLSRTLSLSVLDSHSSPDGIPILSTSHSVCVFCWFFFFFGILGKQ
jgi:hypothetical protein